MIRIILIIIALSFNCYAADIHVGSGQTYTTVAAGITASSSGDTIYIHEGTYNEVDLRPKANTTLSGVDGEDLPIIDSQVDVFSHTWDDNPIYIEVDNVTLYRLDVRDGAAGSVVLRDNGVDNTEISYCRFIRTSGMPSPTADNAGLIYVRPGTTNVDVHHNYFETAVGGYHAMITFNPNGATDSFYNNEMRVNAKAHGYFIKHAGSSTGRLPVYNNFVVMNYSSGTDAAAFYISHDNVDVYNNLVIGDAGKVLRIALDAGGCGGSGLVANHNTFYMGAAPNGTLHLDNDCSETNITFKNSIFRRTSTDIEFRNINGWIYGSAQTWSGHHNMVHQNSAGAILYAIPGTTYTMTEWKSSGQGTGSYDEEAQFVNGSGNLNLISDFEISGGNALNGGDDGEDMGVDISTVGVDAGGESGGTVVKGGVNVSPGANIQ